MEQSQSKPNGGRSKFFNTQRQCVAMRHRYEMLMLEKILS